MGIYHFSLKKISRGKGHSACSKAAYRSGQKLEDRYYGETCDYTRKQGVEHSEILAPEDAPDWVYDREALWNAVEESENKDTNRKWRTAQLALELELALPHELSADDRRELARRFVQEELVSQGMVADLNIHKPDRGGDQRNHHAHIMTTLRELTEDGFGDKQPAWWGGEKGRKSDIVKEYRASWADYVNREYERLGISERVDHRSYADMYIDREPTQHEGPHATAMKRKDEETRIGAENDRREQENAHRADRHVQALKDLAKIAADRDKFDTWAAERRGQLESAQQLSKLDMSRGHDDQMDELNADLKEYYEPSLKTVRHEAGRIQDRLENKGFLARVRRVFTEKRDREKLDLLNLTLRDAEMRMQEQRDGLIKAQNIEKARLSQIQEERRQQQHDGIERARERKEQTLADRAKAARDMLEQRQRVEREAAEHQHQIAVDAEQAAQVEANQRADEVQKLSLQERARQAKEAAERQQMENPSGASQEQPQRHVETERERQNQGPERER